MNIYNALGIDNFNIRKINSVFACYRLNKATFARKSNADSPFFMSGYSTLYRLERRGIYVF